MKGSHAALIIASAAVIAAVVMSPPSVPICKGLDVYLPDLQCTPGGTDIRLPDLVLTSPQFRSGDYRPSTEVTDKIKASVFADYGIAVTPENMAAYELDHLIPIGIGGATVKQNLWPEKWEGQWGAHTKDRLEDYLILQVRAGKMSPEAAREAIREDWHTTYIHLWGEAPEPK